MRLSIRILVCISLLVPSCDSGTGQQGPVDTPTKGEITIAVDETYRSLGQQLVQAYESIYREAKINIRYTSEAEGFRLLMADSVRLVLGARSLKAHEAQTLENRKKFPRTFEVAYDGLALIVNPKNADSTLTLQQIRDIVSGRIRRWSQLNGRTPAGAVSDSIRMVVDQQGSATVNYLVDSVIGGGNLPANVYASKSFPQMIEYVSRNPNALGFTSMPWITDQADTNVLAFNRKVNLVWVKKTPAQEAFRPYQYSIIRRDYPLLRRVKIVLVEPRNGLGTGFAAFATEQSKGQMIAHKMALVPARGFYRLVEVQTDSTALQGTE